MGYDMRHIRTDSVPNTTSHPMDKLAPILLERWGREKERGGREGEEVRERGRERDRMKLNEERETQGVMERE